MKAITTKYQGPKNSSGAHIKAYDMDGNKIRMSLGQESMSINEAHAKAAQMLANKMEWPGKLISGAVKGGFVFVFAS